MIFGQPSWWWLIAAAILGLLLALARQLWHDERSREYSRTLGTDRLPRSPAAWLAPLREPRGEPSPDVLGRRIRLGYRVLDRITRGRYLP